MEVIFILLQIISLYNSRHIKYLNRYLNFFLLIGLLAENVTFSFWDFMKKQLIHCLKLLVGISVNISSHIEMQMPICFWIQITFLINIFFDMFGKCQYILNFLLFLKDIFLGNEMHFLFINSITE